MKICPTCLAQHDDGFSRCPADGAALLALGAEPDPRIGTVVGAAYVLLDVLGAGGMGVVYRAWQRSTAREVAIKTLHPLGGDAAEMMAARFSREARVTASLRSPNTVTIHDFGRLDDGDFYLVMELLHGLPADVLLETRGALPLGLVREIGVQVCRSLAEAHARGVVHRDLKPANLILESTPTGELHVKVLDFGVAKLLEEGTLTLTTTGTTVGTVAYMSPEQVEGTGAVGPPSDLYALGITLFELATGDRPFVADSRLALMFKHASEPPPPLSRFLAPSPEVAQLGKIIDQCLAKAPVDRFPSADALLRALSAPPLGLAPTDGPPAPRVSAAAQVGPATVDGTVRSAVVRGLDATAAEPAASEVLPPPSHRETQQEGQPPRRRPWLPVVAGLVVAGAIAGLVAALASSPGAPSGAGVERGLPADAGVGDVTETDLGPARAEVPPASEASAGTVADVTSGDDVLADQAARVDEPDTAPQPARDTASAPPRDTYTPPRDTQSAPEPDTAPPVPAGLRVSDVRIQSSAPNAREVTGRLSRLVEGCARRQAGLGDGHYRVNFILLRTGALHSVRLSPGSRPARGVEACVKAALAAEPVDGLGGRSDTRIQMTLGP